MNRRSQSRASSIDWIGRCLPGSIRGMANSLAGMRYRLPRNITSKRRCSRHLLPFLQLRSVHLRLMVIASSFMVGSSAVGLRHAGRCAALDPVEHVRRMEATTAHAESLRREQAARVRATHGFLVAADVLGDLECCQQTIRQAASCARRRLRRRRRRRGRAPRRCTGVFLIASSEICGAALERRRC